MASGRDAVKPIPDCPFCCVPPVRRKATFHQEHPRCGACGILMGPGHVEAADAELCSTCSSAGGAIRTLITKQRELALR